jgi:DNA-directed RNA polymerase subunit omega
MRNMDSRYTLVVATAKRARQITDGAEPLTKFRSDKPVTLAVHEIAEGKVDYYRDSARQAEYENDRGPADAAGRSYQLYGGIAGEFDDDEAHGADNGYHDISGMYADYSGPDDATAVGGASHADGYGGMDAMDADDTHDEHDDPDWIE